MEIPVELRRIVITERVPECPVVVAEKDGGRMFPIFVGQHEAYMLNMAVLGQTAPRPMTHNLIAGTVLAMGGRVERLVISDIRNRTFIGSLFLRLNGQLLKVDCRPSDGMVLATLNEAPIFVDEVVFSKLAESQLNSQHNIQHYVQLSGYFRIVILAIKNDDLEAALEALGDAKAMNPEAALEFLGYLEYQLEGDSETAGALQMVKEIRQRLGI